MLNLSGNEMFMAVFDRISRFSGLTGMSCESCSILKSCQLFPSKYAAKAASSSGLVELNLNAKPISEASSTTSAQKVTGLVGSRISSQTNSFTSTLPPVSTKQPLMLRSVTVAFSRERTPSQRAGRFTFMRRADLLSFSITSRFSAQMGNHRRRV